MFEAVKKIRSKFFFTPVGFAFLVIAITILIRSLLARNSYEIVLSSAGLILLLVLGAVGFWKSRKLAFLEPGWKLPFPMTARSGELSTSPNNEVSRAESVVSGLQAGIPLFFRMHFFVRGRFFACGSASSLSSAPNNSCRVFIETSAARKEDTARLLLDFPVSGVFRGWGQCRLKDIFGFFSFSCGVPVQRTVPVRSAPCFGKEYFINPQSGAEDKRNKTSSDEERYYMREYTPGDRLRDINWKSSEKIDALITRISPDTQEKVNRLEVYLRNFGPERPSLEALWLLDRAKARLSHFLRNLMEQKSPGTGSFVFDVRCAKMGSLQNNWEIDNKESLESFLDELACLSFAAPVNETPVTAGMGDIYVFSTACDLGLPAFLLACNPRPVSLFLTQQRDKGQDEILSKRNFFLNGCFLKPKWLLNKKIPQLGAVANKAEMIYAETKL